MREGLNLTLTPSALRNVRIVLCEPSHPGNIGAAARALKTMGLADLRLVKPRRFPDAEAHWRAARAVDVLDSARVHDTLEHALDDTAYAVACTARTRELAVPAVPVREAAARAIDIARRQPTAIVFGNETSGLTTEQVNRCTVIGTIPANPEYASLNLAAAVQVFTYELRLAALSDDRADAPRVLAAHGEIEAFYGYLETLMAQSGFFDPEHPGKLMPRLRRLFARAGLEHEEVNILRGLLKALTAPPRAPAPPSEPRDT